MKPLENESWLDEALTKAIGCEKSQPDFEKWKQDHPEAVESLTSRGGQQPSAGIRPLNIRKIIMKSPIIKLATAAVIIIAAVLLVPKGSVDITKPAFGLEDVYDALQNAEWIHANMTIVQISGDTDSEEKPGIGYGWEVWHSVNPYISIEKDTNGRISFMENDISRTSIYDPASNIITVTYKQSSDSQKTPNSISDMFKTQLLDMVNQGQKVEYNEGVFEGQPVTIISLDYTSLEASEHSIISVVVDPNTYLPKKMDIQQISLKKNISGNIIAIFDYPESGPKDIYEAGAPQDAEVVIIDNRN